jgi:hypothetical protein
MCGGIFMHKKNGGSMGEWGNRRSGGTKASAKIFLQTAVDHHLKVRRRMLKKIKAASSIRKNSMIASEKWAVSRVI